MGMYQKKFHPILGSMHMLKSFTGCMNFLMANIRLAGVLKSTFGEVDKMLLGLNYPQN